MKTYPFICGSYDNPNNEMCWLGFDTYQKAENNKIVMDRLLDEYDINPRNLWDKSFWIVKPNKLVEIDNR